MHTPFCLSCKMEVYTEAGEFLMLNLPSTMQTQFVVFLRNQAVPNEAHASHLKWLRYCLDFCEKYDFPQA